VFLGKDNEVLAPWINDCDEVVVVPVTIKKRRYLPLIRCAFKYRKQFDLVICGWEPRKYVHIFMKILGAKTSVAYVENNWHGKLINFGVLYSDSLQRTRHDALQMLNIVANYRELPNELRPRITIPPAIKTRFLPQILAKFGDKILPPRLLISVTNNRDHSTIDSVMYCELFTELKKQFAFSVVVSYLPKDEERARELAKILPLPAIPIATQDFAEFMVLLDLVDGCFMGDGGIMHLAAALDKPQLVLFGRTSLIEWRPLSDRVQCLYHPEHVKYIDRKEIIVKLNNLLTQIRENK